MRRMHAAAVIVLCFFSTAFAYDWSTNLGDGSAGNPYQISTAEQLNSIGVTATIWNKCFILTNDIDMSVYTGAQYNIIGKNYDYPFTGTFDGNGLTISNLTYTTTSAVNFVGLFGYSRDATVKNIHLEDVTISSVGDYIGGLIGCMGGGQVIQCFAAGSITGRDYTGGLCGYGRNINQCYATGMVTGRGYVGGLCGVGYNNINQSSSACNVIGSDSYVGGLCGSGYNINQCSAAGTVTGYIFVGGLCGYGGTTTESYSTSKVTGSSSEVGGLIGYLSSSYSVSRCYATGAVTGSSNVGGLCGYSYGPSTLISQCYAAGKVIASDSKVGGLCGKGFYVNTTILNCFWDTQSSGQTTSSGGAGKTTAQMKTLSTFTSAGWDFVDTDGDAAEWQLFSQWYPLLGWQTLVGVPDIGGVERIQAEAVLLAAGFRVNDIFYIASSIVPANHIVSQVPSAASELPWGATVNLWVSLGQTPLGTGTNSNPYQIASKSDLLKMAALPEIYDCSFRLTEDIDLTDEIFTTAVIGPCVSGIQGTAFTGMFDGNGHTISNLTITGPENTYVGFFGRVGSGGEIQNLSLVNVDIQGDSYVGSLCGSNENSSIYNCHTTGMVAGNVETGGICGYSKGTFNQCSFSGVVSGMRSESSVGGFCGWNEGSIGQCYAAGTVAGYEANIGGICGINGGGTISQCYSTNTVVGIGVSACAGICSFNVGVIHQSYACGPIGGTHLLGGLCIENIGTITDSFWDIESSMCTVSDGGRGLTSEEMKQSWSFKGWTDGTWTIDEWMDSGPHLGWENYAGMPIMIDYDPPTYMGDGTQENPFQIATADDLICLGRRTPDWDKQFILVSNIDLSGIQFAHAVIGEGGGSFTGVFDGKSHVIRNLTIEEKGIASTGLFYKIGSGGQLKNLGLVNVNIAGNYRVGGLSGINGGGTFQCYVTGTVIGDSYVGGLCGYNMCCLAQCYARGIVTGSGSNIGGLCGKNYSWIIYCYATSRVTGAEYIGGLCGYIEDGSVRSCFWDTETSGLADGYNLSPNYSETIYYVEGRTTAEMKTPSTFISAEWDFLDETENGTEDIWGMKPDMNEGYPYLVPKSLTEGDGSMENPYQISTPEELMVLSKNSSLWDKCFILVNDIDMSAYVGMQYNVIGNQFEPFTGIFDGQGNKISNLFHMSTVDNYLDLGGLFGYIQDATIKNLGLENVYFTGDITVGGLAGNQYGGSIDNCYSTGVIGSYYGGGLVGSLGEGIISNSYSRSSVNSEWGGGLVGVQYGGIITGCYSLGSVTSMAAIESRVGGLVGKQEYGEINNCYSVASIEFNGTEFTAFAGGLAGEAMGSISNCYSTGSITGSGDPNLAGGLVGNGSDVVHSFWDIQSSGLNHSSGGTGKTTAQMKTLSTFTDAGWDFANTWSLCEGTNYPRFSWESITGDFACPDGVNVEDLEYFVGRWLSGDCMSGNNYCGGADLDSSGVVDSGDYAVFAGHWLEGIYVMSDELKVMSCGILLI